MARRDHLVWHGDEAEDWLKNEMVRRLFAASIVVSRHAKELIGKEGVGKRVRAGLTKGAKQRDRVKRARAKARRINKARRTYNKVAGKANKVAKRLGIKGRLKKTKGTFRATKRGTLTKRKRPPRRKRP